MARYGKHPFYLSERETDNDTIDVRLDNGERVSRETVRAQQALARLFRTPSNPKGD